MTGITFYLNILFALLLFWATATAIYMGVFHAHRPDCGQGRKHICLVFSSLLSFVICFFMYTWSYLSW